MGKGIPLQFRLDSALRATDLMEAKCNRQTARIATLEAENAKMKARMDASDVCLQYVSVTLGGTDEWTDQESMVMDIRQTADETAARIATLEAENAKMNAALSGGCVDSLPSCVMGCPKHGRPTVSDEELSTGAAAILRRHPLFSPEGAHNLAYAVLLAVRTAHMDETRGKTDD